MTATQGMTTICISLATVMVFIGTVTAETPFQTAQQYIESGQPTEARRALEAELRVRPNNLEARYNLAILLEQIDHGDEAQKLYRQNISIGRHLPSTINLAALLQDEGQMSEAIKLLESATQTFRSEATPWYLLAQIAEKNGNQIEAIQLFQSGLKADPLNGFAYLHYADYQSRHGMKGFGLNYGAKAIMLLPECAPCWRTYGDILQRANKDAEALAAYQRSLAIDPDDKTRQQLVTTLRSLGQNERATQIQRGLDAHRKHQSEQ